jgi:hypothetical protein
VLVKLPHANPDNFIGLNVGAENEVVIPLAMSSETKGCSVNIPFRKTVTLLKAKKVHGYELGFAITFHKIQGQTCDKLIVDLNERPFQPQVSFATFYVAISRVRRSSDLRLLPLHGNRNLNHLLALRAPKQLHKWLAAYNPRDGLWESNRIENYDDQNPEVNVKKAWKRRQPQQAEENPQRKKMSTSNHGRKPSKNPSK